MIVKCYKIKYIQCLNEENAFHYSPKGLERNDIYLLNFPCILFCVHIILFKKFCLSPFESETWPWCICQWNSSQLHFISLVSYISNVPRYFQVYLLTLPNFLCCFTLCIKLQWFPIIKGVKLKVSQPSIIGLKTVLNYLPNQFSDGYFWSSIITYVCTSTLQL